MSITLVTAAIADPLEDAPARQRPALKLVLVTLAEHANVDGVAWPSRATMADRCCTDWRNVVRRLRVLEQLGRVTVVQAGGGRGRPTRYLVTPAERVVASPRSAPERVVASTTVSAGKGGRLDHPNLDQGLPPYPRGAGESDHRGGTPPLEAEPALPGLAAGAEGLPAVGGRRRDGTNPRARGESPRQVAAADRRARLEELEAEARADRDAGAWSPDEVRAARRAALSETAVGRQLLAREEARAAAG